MEASWSLSEASWRPLGDLLEALGASLGALGASFGALGGPGAPMRALVSEYKSSGTSPEVQMASQRSPKDPPKASQRPDKGFQNDQNVGQKRSIY